MSNNVTDAAIELQSTLFHEDLLQIKTASRAQVLPDTPRSRLDERSRVGSLLQLHGKERKEKKRAAHPIPRLWICPVHEQSPDGGPLS